MTIKTSDLPNKPTSPAMKEFMEYIRSRHRYYDQKECLDLVIKIEVLKEELGRNPSTRDLATALDWKMWKIHTRVKAMWPKYVQIDKRHAGRFYLRIASDFYYTRDKIEEVYELIINELKEFIKDSFQQITSEHCIRAIRILYPKIFSCAKQKKLSKTVKTYRELFEILNNEGIDHNLPDIDIGQTANRYYLTDSGKDAYYAFLRDEYRG